MPTSAKTKKNYVTDNFIVEVVPNSTSGKQAILILFPIISEMRLACLFLGSSSQATYTYEESSVGK